LCAHCIYFGGLECVPCFREAELEALGNKLEEEVVEEQARNVSSEALRDLRNSLILQRLRQGFTNCTKTALVQ
jgi:hypothetical protein